MTYKFTAKVKCDSGKRFSQTLAASIYKARKTEGGYQTKVHSLSGCVSQGDTLAETKRNIREAAELLLEAKCDKQTLNSQKRKTIRRTK